MDVMKKVPVREQAPDVRIRILMKYVLDITRKKLWKRQQDALTVRMQDVFRAVLYPIDIPAFIHQVKEGNIEEAYKIIGKSSALPAVCGRVCPQETQCEGQCIRGIKGESVSIGKLERFVADWARENNVEPEKPTEKKGKKVAVIGSVLQDLHVPETLQKWDMT